MVFPALRDWPAKRLHKTNNAQGNMPPRLRFIRPAVELLEDRCLPSSVNTWEAPGASGDWNVSTNWSLMHVPTASEIATFDGTSQASCLLDAPTVGTNTVSGINISAAYNGVITAGADLVVGTDGFRQAAGTFAATSFKITDSGNWSESSPMGFAAGTGSVNLNGVGPLTLSTNSSFNNLIYSGGPTLTLMTPLTVTGALTVAVATFPGAGMLDVNGQDITVSGLTTITGSELVNTGASPAQVMNLEGGLSLNPGDLVSGAGRIVLGGGDIFATSDSAPSVIEGRLDLAGRNLVVTVPLGAYFGGDLLVFGVISNGGSLTKEGNGRLELANTNTYTGGTFVNAGILDVSKDGALGPGTGGTVVAAAAVLQFSGGVKYNTPEPVTLNGATIGIKAGEPDTLIDSFAGAISLNAAGNMISAPGNFTLNGPINGNGFDLTVIALGTGHTIFNGNLNSGSTLTKQGSGTLTINGTNTFTGGIDVHGGTLAVGNDKALGFGMLTMEDGTAIFAAGSDHSVANAAALAGTVTIAAGPNTLTLTGIVAGNGSLTLNGNLDLIGIDAYSGGTTVNAATLGVNGAPGTGSLTMNNDSILVAVNGAIRFGNPIMLSGTARFGGSNNLTFDGIISGSGSLTDSDTATLNVVNTNSYSGGTNVLAGTLQIGSVSSNNIGSGPLSLNGSTTFEATFGGMFNNAITLNGVSTIIGGGFQSPILNLVGIISGTGGFSTWGTVILTGNNTYSGTTTIISNGFLTVNGSQPNSAIVLTPSMFGAYLNGTGTVGPVTLDQTAIHPGPSNSRDLPGVLTTGSIQLNGGALRIAADGPAAGNGYSQLQVNGTVSLGSGVASLVDESTIRFPPGTRLDIIENLGGMSISGFFAGLPEGTVFTDSVGNQFQITYHGGNGNDAVLIVVPQTEDIIGRARESGQWWVGISNGSNAFNASLWSSWNPAVTWVDVVTGDFTGDGRTDIAARDLNTGNWWVGVSNGSSFTNSLWTSWNPNVTWVDVQVGDFNGDGKADIAGHVLQTGQWWVAQSTGSSFTNSLWTSWTPMATWVDVKVGDFTGDGKADIIGRNSPTGQWWAAISNGSTFTNSLWATWSPAVTWVDVQVGDFDGKGKADIAGRVLQSGQWWVGVSNGSTAFATTLWTTWNPNVTWADVKVGDFNGDGMTDLVGRVAQTGQWWVAQSTGSSFGNSLWTTWNPNVTWVDVHVGDFNGDGKADITGRVLETGQWWTGISNGSSFSNSLWATWSTAVTWVDVRAGDFA